MKIRDMTRCAMFAALLTVCAWLAVPVGDISLSLQTFGVLLCLGVLGGRRGSLTCLVYLTLGALGLPVFTGMQGGLGILIGPTGGYLWGFLLGALMFWLLEGKSPLWLGMASTLLVCYVCGSVWYYLLYLGTGMGFVIGKCVLPYVIPDGIKLLLALTLTTRLRNYS